MKIQANHLANLTDARYFAAWNVDSISFQLDPFADHYIAPNVAEGIRNWVEGPAIIGSFGLSQSPEEVRQIATVLRLDAVQISHFYDINALHGLKTIVHIVIDTQTTAELDAILSRNADLAQYFILDFGTASLQELQDSKILDWNWLCTAFAQYPLWLLYNILPNDLNTLLPLPIVGIVLQGGEEERVGVKSFDALDAILEHLEECNQA